jgi:hypothetical protein
MTKYDVTWVKRFYTAGTVQIEAESKDAAEDIAWRRMQGNGPLAECDDPEFTDELQSEDGADEIISVRESED